MKSYLSTKLGKASIAVFILLVVSWLVLRIGPGEKVWPLLDPILLALILTAVLWVAVDLGYKAWQQRKQASFDAKLAAREGIEDRKREWGEWTAELHRQGIDRYQLPMYLLVGEPQSGKSIMLRNSDLYFPFGQNRLSGVGGTKGCDWWFTDEAVILDLAGRLFTHEGGASDEAEWAAFLELLADYRPQCPANGVILVLPCDGLANDSEPEIARKATKMQTTLTTLTGKLQARLPVYVVLTKADKVFGFAECVHRLDAPKRHEMFGWSRPLEKLAAPFDVAEARGGFQSIVERARLLRSQMMATARIPEALGEVDRFYAFPEELSALWPMLSLYLQRVFTESRLIDNLFFRGFYLTSGLQSGAPIAKVCAELMGNTGEADRRSLEGLFTKQRAYFIKDLVRERIFSEKGLVRPTKQRVVRARRNALVAYGAAGLGALVSLIWTSSIIAKESSDEMVDAVNSGFDLIEEGDANQDPLAVMSGVAKIQRTIDDHARFYPFNDATGPLESFNEETIAHTAPTIALEAARDFVETGDPTSYVEFESQKGFAELLLSNRVDNGDLGRLRSFLKKSRGWDIEVVTTLSNHPLNLPPAEKDAVRTRIERLWDESLQAGSGWARPGALGVVLACQELFVPGRRMLSDWESCDAVERRINAVELLVQSQGFAVEQKEKRATTVTRKSIEGDFDDMKTARAASVELAEWTALAELRAKVATQDYKVPEEAIALLANERLKAICAPSFLTLTEELSSLPIALAQAPPPENSKALEFFEAKRKCVGNAYIDTYGSTARLREGLGIVDSSAFAPTLAEHLGGMFDALTPVQGSPWRLHVERLVDEYEKALLAEWEGDPDGPDDELERHLDSLGLDVTTSNRDAWLRGVEALLAERLGGTVREAAEEFMRIANRGGVSEFDRPLLNAATGLRNEGLPADRISSLLVRARPVTRPPSGAAAFVELSFRALCERALHLKIRDEFLKELATSIGPQGASRKLVEGIWNAPVDNLDLKFFDRDGDLDELREKYEFEVAPAVPTRWSLAEFRGPDPTWEAVEFLLALQSFLLDGDPDGKRASGATVTVDVRGNPESEAFSSGERNMFFLHAGENKISNFIEPEMKPLSIQWSFGTAKKFQLRWCDAAPSHPDDLVVPKAGPLAPLLLAWDGDQTHEGDWRLQTTLTTAPGVEHGLELSADVTIGFDRPLPPRPTARPFSDP